MSKLINNSLGVLVSFYLKMYELCFLINVKRWNIYIDIKHLSKVIIDQAGEQNLKSANLLNMKKKVRLVGTSKSKLP